MSQKILKRLVSTVEAAETLNLSTRTIANLIREKKLDSVLIGRRRLVKVDSLNRLAEHGTGAA